LRECTPKRTADNIRDIISLCEYSRQTLQEVRAETGIDYDCLTKGILHFYTDQKEFNTSLSVARQMREFGCPRESISVDEVVRIEPALAQSRHKIVGGDFTATDESGDIFKFTSGLAEKAITAGVSFKFNTQITRLVYEGVGAARKINGVEVINQHGYHETISADAFVVALGSFSGMLLEPLGINLLIYPGKGYSATYKIINSDAVPTVSLTDDGCKLVTSRLGDRLRVAGTCELNGYSRELFPAGCDYDNPVYWAGLRPMTPNNIPYIGKTNISNLFLNTGHGTLGWTMGCGSGRAIADMVSGRRPDFDFRFI